jgi:hypothetical protein
MAADDRGGMRLLDERDEADGDGLGKQVIERARLESRHFSTATVREQSAPP